MNQSKDPGQATCPECGASWQAGLSCWEQLGVLLAWEWQDPALQAEHFLIVACYNLQHPAQFTDVALAELCTAFTDYLDKGVTTAEIRARMSPMAEGKQRVLRKESERWPVLRRWRMTIADVYLSEQKEGAAARVKEWAVNIRENL